MDTLEERVDRAITTAKVWWLVHALVAVPLLLWALSGWWLLLIPVYLSITYQVAVHLVAARVLRSIQPELHELMQAAGRADAMAAFTTIKQRLDGGEIEPGPELYELMGRAGLSIGVIRATSKTILGKLGDVDIFEWVELYDPVTDEVKRFLYEEVAVKNAQGEYILPSYEDKLAAIVNGLVYSRPLQPAQGE